jgi:uncharacterized protein YdaU (DUF1376 family)
VSITHIPFYPSDWLAGTRGMTAEEMGVYITLIARMYEMAGPIERDDERLYRICGCKSKKAFQKVASYLVYEGKVQEENGQLFNERVQKEIKKVVEKSSKAKDAAEARWKKKPSKINNSGDADALQADMLGECQPEPEPYIEDTNVSLSLVPTDDRTDEIQEAISLFKESAKRSDWPMPRILSKARRASLKARLKECDGLEGWRIALSKAEASDHCCGKNERGWVLNFDFITSPSGFAKLMEGNYDNRTNSKARPTNADTTAFAISAAAKARRKPDENCF